MSVKHEKIRVLAAVLVAFGLQGTLLGDGLDGEYVLTQRWRDLFAGQSALSNPSFLTDENYVTVRGAFSPTLHNEFKLWEAGITVPIGLFQSAGFTWLGEDDGVVNPARVDPVTGRLEPSDEELRNIANTFYLSYAVNPWKRLSVGGNVIVARRTNFEEPKNGFGLDLGISYRPLRHQILGDHAVGVMFQNLIPPNVSVDRESRYSANLKLSWLAEFLEGKVESGIDLDIKDFMSQGKTFVATGDKSAVEYDFNYRLGGWLFHIVNAYFQIGSGYWGLGAGMNVPTVNSGRDMAVWYQYTSLTEGRDVSSHTVYLRLEMGKHREEIYARRMARIASLSPNELYNKAMRLYMAGKYWDAYFVYGQILSQFPDFFKNDWVRYYGGSCLEEMDMRVRANETYGETKDAYPRSNVVPYADLGIMRVHYRDNNGTGVTFQFDLLDNPDVPDSLKHHAYYLMGQQFMRQGENRKALPLFDRVPENHPEYVFAQHSAGVVRIMDLGLEEAMLNLENCLQARQDTKAQKEVAGRSALLLGYIFYEKYLLSKAVTALRMVGKDSYYYEDALLGLGWTALKASQWTDCVAAGKSLTKVSKKPVLKAEGRLLEAYGYMMQKNYPLASDALKDATLVLSVSSAPSADSLANRRRVYENERMSYGFLSGEVKRMSVVDPSEAAQRVIDSLHNDQQAMARNLSGFIKYVDEFGRSAFFSRSIEKVRDDVEYAAAVVDKFLGRARGEDVQKSMKKEADDLDKEIEKLQREMDGLEEAPNNGAAPGGTGPGSEQ